MSTPATAPPEPGPPAGPRDAALARLREGTNPFTFSVVTAGSEDQCAAVDVPALLESHLADLRAIVARYRDGHPPAQVYPVVGDPGTGKSHLLTRYVTELNRDAEEAGAESVVLFAGHVPPNLNGVDYLYRLLVDHLLAARGPGLRTLTAVAGRLAARLVGESVRQLAPHQQVELIPPAGLWERLRLRVGSSGPVQARLDAVAGVATRCDAPRPRPADVIDALTDAGVSPADAFRVVAEAVDRAESKDVRGWVRRELYTRLVRLALAADRQPLEELLLGEVPHPPTAAGAAADGPHRTQDRWLLTAWLELLDELAIPVLLVFDQLEEEVRRVTEDVATEAARAFIQVLASIVNGVPDVCILLFTEESLWDGILRRADRFAHERLTQQFSFPGRASQRVIRMPHRIDPTLIGRLIRQRVRTAAPDLDLTGLPETFPFDPDRLRDLERETTVRACVRRLARWYDQIVFHVVDEVALRTTLTGLWRAAVAGVAREIGDQGVYTAAKIPEVQTAIDGWLRLLHQEGLTGAGPWARVDLEHDEEKRQYGYLNVIRTDGPDAPGVGVAAWLAEGAHRANDLRHRLAFFQANPCPVRTLVLLRRDGGDALAGAAGQAHKDAVGAGRDVRIVRFEPRHVHALFAVDRWRQSAGPEVDAQGPGGRAVFRQVLEEVAAEFLRWIDEWRAPPRRGV